MTQAEYAISRLTAWLRDYGEAKTPEFVSDIKSIITEVARLKEEIAGLREEIDALNAIHKTESKAALILQREVVRLRSDAESFQMAYRLKADENTKSQAVEIERIQREIVRLQRECALYLHERQEMRSLFSTCLEEYGPTLLEAMKSFTEKARKP